VWSWFVGGGGEGEAKQDAVRVDLITAVHLGDRWVAPSTPATVPAVLRTGGGSPPLATNLTDKNSGAHDGRFRGGLAVPPVPIACVCVCVSSQSLPVYLKTEMGTVRLGVTNPS
jgi:hypothetical protein